VPPHRLRSRWAPLGKWLKGLSFGPARGCWQKDGLTERCEERKRTVFALAGSLFFCQSYFCQSSGVGKWHPSPQLPKLLLTLQLHNLEALAHVSHLLGGTKQMVAGRARISRNVKSERSYRFRSHPRRYLQISGK
jgi:hypothetical protein